MEPIETPPRPKEASTDPLRPADRIKGFDGIRALAVTFVIIMHKTMWGEETQLGFYGVWLFFLLSGFLITDQLAQARKRIETENTSIRAELVNFWTRRFFRIFPAYYALITLIIISHIARGKPIQETGIWYHVFYLTNIYFEYVQRGISNSFMHFWSLSVEEQFYLLFAPMVLFIGRRHLVKICGLLILASLVTRFTMVWRGAREFDIYIDSFVNFGLLALGGLLLVKKDSFAAAARKVNLGGERAPWLLLAAFFGMILLLWMAQEQPSSIRQLLFSVAMLVGAGLVFAVYLGQGTLFTRLLEWGPWAYYGRLSYGFYLYQTYPPADLPERALALPAQAFPALRPLAAEAARNSGFVSGFVDVLGFIVCFAITMVLTQLSWSFIEKPALRMRDRLFGMHSSSRLRGIASRAQEAA